MTDASQSGDELQPGGTTGAEHDGGIQQVAAESQDALDEALNKLGEMDADKRKLVELRYFAGCNVEETAKVLGKSSATVKRDWRVAKAWLKAEMSRGDQA